MRFLIGWVIAAIGALGFAGSARAEDGKDEDASSDEGEGTDLPSSPPWRRTEGVWREAEAIASGQKIVDARARARVLAELAAASGRADALAKAGKLSAEEHALVRKDLIDLIAALNALDATTSPATAPALAAGPRAGAKAGPGRVAPVPPRPQITCYGPRRIDHDRSAREVGMRLAARLPLLRKLIAAGKLQPAVVTRLLVSLRGDVAYLESSLASRTLAPGIPPAERIRLRKLARDVKAVLARLERKLPK